jgi:putative DNA topoisomerase
MVLQKNAIQILKSKNVLASRNIVKPTKNKAIILKNEIKQYFDNNGYLSWSSKKKMYIILGTNSPQNGLVKCPECKIGELMVIRSYKTKKRFLGCSNYYNGCKASSPLLQKAKLRATKIPCNLCSWPIIIFRYSRRQKWTRQCSNFRCQSRNLKV